MWKGLGLSLEESGLHLGNNLGPNQIGYLGNIYFLILGLKFEENPCAIFGLWEHKKNIKKNNFLIFDFIMKI